MILLRRALLRGWRQIFLSPAIHAMAALALALATFLAGTFGLFLFNLDHALHQHRGSAQFQLYWKPGADMAQVRGQWESIQAYDGVTRCVFFTPEEALEGLKKDLGPGLDSLWQELERGAGAQAGPQAGVAAGIGLPPTALVTLDLENADLERPQRFLERVKALPGLGKVRMSPMQIDVAQALRRLSVRSLIPLSVCLSLVIALVAYISARLCLEGRRAEVEIMRLVGAVEWYVRLPWAVSAGLTGLAGGLTGLAALRLLQALLAATLYEAPLWIRLVPLPLEEAAAMALMALAMSALGGWLAARE